MYDFLDENNVLSTCQYGFRKNHSTEHALHDAITHVCKALNTKKGPWIIHQLLKGI